MHIQNIEHTISALRQAYNIIINGFSLISVIKELIIKTIVRLNYEEKNTGKC